MTMIKYRCDQNLNKKQTLQHRPMLSWSLTSKAALAMRELREGLGVSAKLGSSCRHQCSLFYSSTIFCFPIFYLSPLPAQPNKIPTIFLNNIFSHLPSPTIFQQYSSTKFFLTCPAQLPIRPLTSTWRVFPRLPVRA